MVEMYEIPSGNQTREELLQRMQAAMDTVPIEYRTDLDINVNIIDRDP